MAKEPAVKIDRRVQRTKRALRDALISLILEKGYDSITVQEITDRAELNRGTLYLHYDDKHDLLLSSSEDTYQELIAQFEPIRGDNLTLDVPEKHLILVFEHVAARADFYRVMLGPDGVALFTTRLRQVVTAVSRERLAALRGLAPATSVSSELIAHFMGGAIVGVIQWWLETDMAVPVEALAQQTIELVVQGVYPAIGLEQPPLIWQQSEAARR